MEKTPPKKTPSAPKTAAKKSLKKADPGKKKAAGKHQKSLAKPKPSRSVQIDETVAELKNWAWNSEIVPKEDSPVGDHFAMLPGGGNPEARDFLKAMSKRLGFKVLTTAASLVSGQYATVGLLVDSY